MAKMNKNLSDKTDNNQQNSRLLIVLAALSFIVPLLLIYSYDYSEKNINLFGWQLKKLSSDSEEYIPKKSKVKIKIVKPNEITEDVVEIIEIKKDTLLNTEQQSFGEPIIDTTEFERSHADPS